jgi:hypothetical protein
VAVIDSSDWLAAARGLEANAMVSINSFKAGLKSPHPFLGERTRSDGPRESSLQNATVSGRRAQRRAAVGLTPVRPDSS